MYTCVTLCYTMGTVRFCPVCQGGWFCLTNRPTTVVDRTMPVGTQDFYFDIAEELNELEVEFVILARDSNKKAVSIMCNTANPETLMLFAKTLNSMRGDSAPGGRDQET
jgi:hypothetical protein